MNLPQTVLGNDLMDEDHARLETLFAGVAATADGDLAQSLADIGDELRAHFAREEAMMREAGLPILHCHIAQHSMLLEELRTGHAAAEAGDHNGLRRFLVETLPQLVAGHIDSVDRVSASFLALQTDITDLSGLRLPVPPTCA